MVILGLRVFKNSLSFIFKKGEIILPHLDSDIVILVKTLLSFDGALINIFFWLTLTLVVGWEAIIGDHEMTGVKILQK